jgi:hypothetical protein
MTRLTLSCLPHTWLIDIDGTIFLHNGHKTGPDQLLPGVKEFWDAIPEHDCIILLSARMSNEAEQTAAALRAFGLRYDRILYDLPKGERVLVNDRKPGGLVTAHSINLERDAGLQSVDVHLSNEI